MERHARLGRKLTRTGDDRDAIAETPKTEHQFGQRMLHPPHRTKVVRHDRHIAG
jgi:hypothetical protein